MREFPKNVHRIKWAKSFKTGKRWLDGVAADYSGSEATQRMYARALTMFCDFTGKNPDELIEERKEQLKSDNEEIKRIAEEKLKEFCLYLQREKGITSTQYHAAIRSFYKFNYQPLMVRTPKSVFGIIAPITLDEFKTVDMATNERQRAHIRFLKDSGMSREDAVEVTYGQIRKEFEAGKRFIHLNVKRKKESLRYETFIGPNAVEALKIYLMIRKNNGEILNDETPLLANNRGRKISADTLSVELRRLGKKVGITLSPHRIRKMYESYMALIARHPIVLKYWMGHKIGGDVEAHYIIPPVEEQRKLYMEAYKQIDLEATKINEEERRIQATFDNLRLTGFSEDEIERYRQERGKTWHTARELIAIIREKRSLRIKKVKKRTEANGGSATDCQRIVTEQELEPYLAKGWRVQAVLPSGKVVISSEM